MNKDLRDYFKMLDRAKELSKTRDLEEKEILKYKKK